MRKFYVIYQLVIRFVSSIGNTFFIFNRGSTETSSLLVFDKLSNWAKKSINKRFKTPKHLISMDLDAYSVVIRTTNMGMAINSFRRYLLAFGGSLPSKCGFPLMATGSRTKDGIFGCHEKSGQHLPPILQGNEMLVLDTPVKIALHKSCKHPLIDWLTLHDYYFKAASDKSGLCFDTKYMSNKPPYSVLIEGIIACCRVADEYCCSGESVHIVHVADMGFRLPLPSFLHLTTCILPTGNDPHIEVEIVQVDIAFSCKQEKMKLIQATCCTNPFIPKNSLLQGSFVNIFPIHSLPPLKGPTLGREVLRGTIQLKKRKWECGKNVIRLCEAEDDVTMSDNRHHNGVQEITDLFSTSKQEGNTRDSISVLSSSIYSLKAYSTIAHVLLQNRSKFPLTFKDMFGVGKRSIEALQSLVVNADKSQQQAFTVAKEQGFSFRLEVSIRPHFNDPLRKKGHLNDMLLIACVAVSEFCHLHQPLVTLLPTATIETESMKLIHEARDLLRTRQAIKFESRFKSPRATEWLRFHLSLMLITIGICPSFHVKYINQWLNNENRFDPNHRALSFHNFFDCQPQSNCSELKLSRLLKRTMLKLQFPRHVAEDFESFLKQFVTDFTQIDCRKVYMALNLKAKHMLAYNMWRNIIPTMLELNNLEDCSEEKLNKTTEDNDPDIVLHYDGDWVPDTDPRWNDYTKQAPDHPLGLALLFLTRLSNFWIHRRQAFNQRILSNFVLKCHKSEILSHPKINDDATVNILSQCSNGAKIFTIDDIFQVCSVLCGKSSTRGHKSEAYYLQILHEFYNFPCSEKPFQSKGKCDDSERNIILNQVLQLDLVVTVSETITSKKIHRFADNSCIDIPVSSHIFQLGTQPLFETLHQDADLFIVLRKSLNLKESSCVRQIWEDYLTKTDQNLEYTFLTENGTTNAPFVGMHNFHLLSTKFKFLQGETTIALTSTCDISKEDEFHQVMFAISSVAYESDITFYNSRSRKTLFFSYCQLRSVIYKHQRTDVILESNQPKSLIFQLGSDGKYKWINLCSGHSSRFCINSMSPVGGMVKTVTNLTLVAPNLTKSTNHKNFHDSISKLLKAMDENYMEDGRLEEDDSLGLKTFFNQLSSSRQLSKHFEGFHKDVVLQCATLGMSLRTVSTLLNDGDLSLMGHEFLSPIICLKYSNLTLGVIENIDRKKTTHFYAFNSLTNQVVCVKHRGICLLTSRPETLYLYTNRTTYSYWYPSAMSNLRTKITWWKHHNSILGKYACAGHQDFRRYLQTVNEFYSLNVISNIGNMTNFEFRPEMPEKVILGVSLTLNSGNFLYFSQWNIEHHAIVIIFPRITTMDNWDACIVHHPDQDPTLAKKYLVDSILAHAPRSGTYSSHCIKGFGSNACESGFFIILCAYLGSQCHNVQDYERAINRLHCEANVCEKTRMWMHNILEIQQDSQKTISSHKTPYWIRQITWKASENIFSKSNSYLSNNSLCTVVQDTPSIPLHGKSAEMTTNLDEFSSYNDPNLPISKNHPKLSSNDQTRKITKFTLKLSGSSRKKNLHKEVGTTPKKKKVDLLINCKERINLQIRIASQIYFDRLIQQNCPTPFVESSIRSVLGLQNPTNDCYINAIIQLLFGMKCTREYFLHMNFVLDLKLESSEVFVRYLNEGGSIALSLGMLFEKMNSELFGLSVKDFKEAIVTLNDGCHCYDNNSQQDAHELLTKVFDSLSDTFVKYHNKDPIGVWFRSCQKGIVVCSKCKMSSTNELDKSFVIELCIVGTSLESCVKSHLKTIQVNELKCSHCNAIGFCTKSTIVMSSPIVTFMLKRFNNGLEKNHGKVQFPIKDFPIFNHDCYDLAAIISHRGKEGSIYSGHFVTSIRIGYEWIEFDDNNVSRLNLESSTFNWSELWSDAYILVYCRSSDFESLISAKTETCFKNV